MPEVNDQEGKELIFQEGPLRLSRKTIRAFNRTYAIRRVEKVGVRRDPLYIVLGIAVYVASSGTSSKIFSRMNLSLTEVSRARATTSSPPTMHILMI